MHGLHRVKDIHPVSLLGWALLILGLVLYVGAIVAAVVRVHGQYSSAMAGGFGLRMSAALGTAGKRWPFLVLGAIGIILLLIGR